MFLAPSVALASWWNPFSWFNGWSFQKSNQETKILEERIQELEAKLNEPEANLTTTEITTEQQPKTTQQPQISERIVEKPVFITKEVPQKSNPESLPESAQEIKVTESTIMKIPVEVYTSNTFSETEGWSQFPASVGYSIANKYEVDIPISSINFTIDKVGDHQILYDKATFSISTSQGNKEDGYFMPNTQGKVRHNLENSIIVPAYSNKTIYINVWNISGDVRKRNPSSGKTTTFILEKVSTNMNSVEFDLGLSGQITTVIPHSN